MPWFPAGSSALEALVSFLVGREWSCAGFSSQLHQRGAPRLPNRRHATVQYYTGGTPADPILAAVLQTTYGFWYPVFGDLGDDERRNAVEALRPRLQSALSRYLTIMGLESDVTALERQLVAAPRHRVEYFMMQATGPPIHRPSVRLAQRPVVREARPGETKRLLALQIAYEREEVLLPNRVLNVQAARRQLRNDLRHQVIYVAELDGVPIAKAGTNARGFRYDQIGGVFTDPRYRNCGVGTLLMDVLMRRLRREGKAVCLFVKTHNFAARRMYENLGFSHGEQFVISYYH